MISKVAIKGYQSLHDVSLDLEAFTLIVGESDSGKSAFIRALKGWAENQSGESFITVQKKSSSVQVTFDDGSNVIWSKPANEFLLGDGTTYKTFSKAGRSVPDEIRDHTGFIDVVFDDDFSDLVNFASQFDPPFLLTESGTRIAKVLGKLSGIEFIYNAQRLASKEASNKKSELVFVQNQLVESEQMLAEYKDLDRDVELHSKLVSLMSMIENLLSESTALLAAHSEVTQWSERVQILEQELAAFPDNLPDLTKIESAIHTVAQQVEAAKSVELAMDEVDSLAAQLNEVDRELKQANSNLAEYQRSFDICPFCERIMDHEH